MTDDSHAKRVAQVVRVRHRYSLYCPDCREEFPYGTYHPCGRRLEEMELREINPDAPTPSEPPSPTWSDVRECAACKCLIPFLRPHLCPHLCPVMPLQEPLP